MKDRVLQSSSLVRLGGGHDQIQAVAQGVLQSEAVKKKQFRGADRRKNYRPLRLVSYFHLRLDYSGGLALRIFRPKSWRPEK